MTQPQQSPVKEEKGLLRKAKEKLVGKPKEPEHWGILKKEAGFIPLNNQDDTQQRRQEIIDTMKELRDVETRILTAKTRTEIEKNKQLLLAQAYKLAQLFELYFTTGSPWVRGKDNSELSTCTSLFIQNFEEFGDIPEAYRDLHAEVMYLLHLSWQGIDVTNTPPYIIQTTPLVSPYGGRIDLSGGTTGNAPTSKSEDV